MNTTQELYRKNRSRERMALLFLLAATFLVCMMEHEVDMDWMALGVHTTYLIKLLIHISIIVLCLVFHYRSLKDLDFINYDCLDDSISEEEYNQLHLLLSINVVAPLCLMTYCFSCSAAYTLLYFFNY